MKRLLIRRILIQATFLGISFACCISACMPIQDTESQDIGSVDQPNPSNDVTSSPQSDTPSPPTATIESNFLQLHDASPDPTDAQPVASPVKPLTATATPTPLTGCLVFESRREDTNGNGIVDEQDGIHVFRLDILTNEFVQLTSGTHQDKWPTWSPTGSQIAFASNRNGNFDLFIMESDGSEVTQLTKSPEDEITPVWSPNGNELVYTSSKILESGMEETRLMSIRLDDGRARQLTFGPNNDHSPQWSLDGRYVAFWRLLYDESGSYQGRAVYLLDMQTTDEIQLTSGIYSPPGVEFAWPGWLPVAGYTLSLQELAFDEGGNTSLKIYSLQLKSDQPSLDQRLQIDHVQAAYTWGANGEWLLATMFNGMPANGIEGSNLDIKLLHLKTLPEIAQSTQLTSSPAGQHSERVSLLDDGRLITDNLYYDNNPDWTDALGCSSTP